MTVGVGSWIERRARTSPERIALVAGDRPISYADWADRIRRLANGLHRLGVRRGDRVAWLGPNHPAFLDSLFAAGLLGAALAPVNHRLATIDIEGILADTEPAVLIRYGTAEPALPESVRHRISVDSDFEALIAGSPDDPVETPVGTDDICLLPHTSGTTGRPKAIMLTHANVTWNVVNLLSCAEFHQGDVTVAVAPFFRVGGTGVNVLPVLFLGGTLVVPSRVDADGILTAIQRHRVTVGFGNPDVLDALTRSAIWPDADLSSVRFVLTGGAPVPVRLIRAYRERGLTLLQGYGLSEAAPLALLLDPDRALTKIGSAGRPPLLVDVRIVRPDGTEVDAGETGELLVRGPNVMAGYWRRPETTRQALSSDGWLRTGDAARRDEDGDIWIVDRVADRFLSGGRLVYPGDVERVLTGHPGVADAGVVRTGRGVAALVVPSPGSAVTEDEILGYGLRHLPPYEVPVTVRFVDRLPRNSVGKMIRADLSGPFDTTPHRTHPEPEDR
jgi:fatty-acyl-CoA synthase